MDIKDTYNQLLRALTQVYNSPAQTGSVTWREHLEENFPSLVPLLNKAVIGIPESHTHTITLTGQFSVDVHYTPSDHPEGGIPDIDKVKELVAGLTYYPVLTGEDTELKVFVEYGEFGGEGEDLTGYIFTEGKAWPDEV